MRSKRLFTRTLAVITASALAAAGCSSGANDEDPSAYPQRPVQIVVGFNAGGALDLVARELVKDLPKDFGQTAVVVNQPGDGGVIGASSVIKAEPDGYTAYLGSVAAMALQPWRKGSTVPYGGPKDYTPVANILAFPQVMAVPASAPYNTPEEFVTYVKDRPGRVRVGTGGIGTLPDVALSKLKKDLDLDLVSVPFQGFAQSVPAILGGSIEAIIASPADAKPHVASGDLKLIGSFNDEAVPGFPQVKSFTTAGLEYTQDNYYFLILPPGTDPAVVDTLSSAVKSAVESDAFQKWTTSNSAIAQYQDAGELTDRLQGDYDRYQTIIQDLGL